VAGWKCQSGNAGLLLLCCKGTQTHPTSGFLITDVAAEHQPQGCCRLLQLDDSLLTLFARCSCCSCCLSSLLSHFSGETLVYRATTYKGDSGSPLLTADGEIVGLHVGVVDAVPEGVQLTEAELLSVEKQQLSVACLLDESIRQQLRQHQ
jgi:hypothetical protein